MTSLPKAPIRHKYIAEFYEIGNIVGKGGSGTVYSCKSKKTENQFAVKVIPYSPYSFNEIMNWRDIGKNPNVLDLIEIFICDENIYVVMELMSHSLTEILPSLQQHMPMLLPQMNLKIIFSIISGVNHLHAKGIIHGDIKSDNVFCDATGQIKIGDFGSSIPRGKTHPNAPYHGTVWWNSPNSLNLATDPVTASPIKDESWSIGVTICEILGMTPPFFHIQNPHEAFYHIKNLQAPPPLPKLDNYGKDFEDKIHAILEVCFEMDPKDRFLVEELLMLFQRLFPDFS